MTLPQIRRVWISPRVKEMLHSMAVVRISFDAKAGNQPDRQHVGFAERVVRVAAHRGDKHSHIVRSLAELDANGPYDLAPLLCFLSDEPPEVRRGTWQD